ncbi:MAG: PucR family transcriptional regulator, partial [Frankia sp.]|nr:PucR family transcriptional regulator [Frankia sp.]
MTAEPAGPGPAGADDGLASLEAELVAAALDGAEWPALLARLAGAAGRPARLLGMDGRLLASASPPGPG